MFVSNVPRVKMGILFRKTRENSVWYVSSESPLTSNKLINSCFARACWQMWFTSSLNVAKVLPVICEVCKCARISFQFWNIAETLTSRTSRSTMTLNVFFIRLPAFKIYSLLVSAGSIMYKHAVRCFQKCCQESTMSAFPVQRNTL